MALSEDQKLNLVIATLATYSYPLEKAWELREEIQKAGLSTPSKVIGKDVGKVGVMMIKAGYDRGGITFIIAPRIASLMQAVKDGDLDVLAKHIDSSSESKFCEILKQVKGFGPKSSQLAWELMKKS